MNETENESSKLPEIRAEDVEHGERLVRGQDEGRQQRRGRRGRRSLHQRGVPLHRLGEPFHGRRRHLPHLVPQFVLEEAVAARRRSLIQFLSWS